MIEQKKLMAELKGRFPEAEVKIEDDISISLLIESVYSADRQFLILLQKKYQTGLWNEARNGKVYYYFHSFGGKVWK